MLSTCRSVAAVFLNIGKFILQAHALASSVAELE
jgi:hypothetical protein